MPPYRTRSISVQHLVYRAAKTGMNIPSVVYAASMRFLSHIFFLCLITETNISMAGVSQRARLAVAEDCAGEMSIVPAVIRELAVRFFLV